MQYHPATAQRKTSMQRPQPFTLAVPVNHTDHILGPISAKVTVVEYGDFECPSCGQAYPAVKMLLKHFGDRMRFVYRHFPLVEVHPHAELAAEAAEAAGAQHKFWQMHEHIDGGVKSEVRSTPAFFVNGAVEDVSFGLERLEKAVEAALGK